MREICKKIKNLMLVTTVLILQQKALAQNPPVLQAPQSPVPMGPIIQSTNPTSRAAESQALEAALLQKQQELQAAQAAAAAAAAAQSKAAAQMMSPVVPQLQNTTPTANPYMQQNLINTLDMIYKINSGNQAVKRVQKLNDTCATCELSETYARDTEQTRGLSGKLEAPIKNENNSTHSRSTRCGSHDGYETCIFEGDVTPGRFEFLSKGPNDKADDANGRLWTFNLENKARQDLGFSVIDLTGNFKKDPKSYMMVFPRKYLPTIKVEGNKQIVTLPTGETVTYDAKTKAIIDGAFSEEPKDGKSFPKVKYQGSGVLVRIDGKDQRSDPRQSNGQATITKGTQSCQVPARALWPDQSDRSALHFKFASDEEFDSFLKKTCNFGI